MKRFLRFLGITITGLFLLLILAITAACWWQPDPKPVVLPNPKPVSGAAVFYYQAFAAMPELTAAEKKLISPQSDAPFDANAVQQVLAKYDSSLKLFAQGAAQPECEWGLDYSKGPAMELPFLSKTLNLSQLLAMRVRLRLQKGESPAATDDLLLIFRYGRHLGQMQFLISRLVEMSNNMLAIRLATRNLQAFDSPSLQRLSKEISALPPSPSIKDLMEKERILFSSWLGNILLSSPISLETVQKDLEQVGSFKIPTHLPKIFRVIAVKYMAYSLNRYEQKSFEWEQLMDEPFAQARPKIAAFEESLIKNRWIDGPLVGLALPALSGVRHKEADEASAWDILRTAVATQLHNPDELRSELAKLRDPYDNSPIEMRDVNDGVELKLKGISEKKNVVFVVGLPKK